MPITIQVTQGLISVEDEPRAVNAVTEAILRANGALNNPLTRRHLIVTLLTVPKNSTYADSKLEPFILVSVRNPTGSLVTQEQRDAFVSSASEALYGLVDGRIERDRIYINLLYGDGMWGIGGTAFTDTSLTEAFAASEA